MQPACAGSTAAAGSPAPSAAPSARRTTGDALQDATSVARGLFLGGRCALVAVAAHAAHRATEKLGLLVGLLEAVAPALLARGFTGLGLSLGMELRLGLGLAALAVALSPVPIAVAAVAVPEAALIAPERPVVAAALEGRGLARLLWTRLRLRLGERRRLEAVVQHVLAFLVAELVAVAQIGGTPHALAVAVELGRLTQLLAVGHYDAIVVLGVLKVVFRQYRIAGRLGVAGERKILFGNVRRSAPDLHVRSIGLEAAR